jgi:hypothetical protein
MLNLKAYITFKAGADIALFLVTILMEDRMVKNHCSTQVTEKIKKKSLSTHYLFNGNLTFFLLLLKMMIP